MLTPTCVWHCLFAVCITIDPVAPETLTDGLRSFCAEFSAEMVNTCAACGCRDMVNTHPCTIEEGGVLFLSNVVEIHTKYGSPRSGGPDAINVVVVCRCVCLSVCL